MTTVDVENEDSKMVCVVVGVVVVVVGIVTTVILVTVVRSVVETDFVTGAAVLTEVIVLVLVLFRWQLSKANLKHACDPPTLDKA
jgi:hypothetical protein